MTGAEGTVDELKDEEDDIGSSASVLNQDRTGDNSGADVYDAN